MLFAEPRAVSIITSSSHLGVVSYFHKIMNEAEFSIFQSNQN